MTEWKLDSKSMATIKTQSSQRYENNYSELANLTVTENEESAPYNSCDSHFAHYFLGRTQNKTLLK
jgi:hypothetical protein